MLVLENPISNQKARILHRLAQTMHSDLQDLNRCYNQLYATIKKEYEAVETHKINIFEDAILAKKQLAMAIEEVSDKLKGSIQHLFETFEITDSEVNLSTLRKLLVELINNDQKNNNQKKETLIPQSLLTNFARLEAAITGVLQLYQNVYLEIKKNKHILGRLLKNHQSSYRFWQENLGTGNSSYNEKGNKSKGNALSQFSTKV